MNDMGVSLPVKLKHFAQLLIAGAEYLAGAVVVLLLIVAGLFLNGTFAFEDPPYEVDRESLMSALIPEEELPPNWQLLDEPRSIQEGIGIRDSDGEVMGHCNQPRIDDEFPDAADRGVVAVYGQGIAAYPNVAVLLWPFDESVDAAEMIGWMGDHWDCEEYTLVTEDSSTRFSLTTADFNDFGEDEFKRRIFVLFEDNDGEEHRIGAIDMVSVRERNIVVGVSTTLEPSFPVEVDEEIEDELTLVTDAFVNAALSRVKDLD